MSLTISRTSEITPRPDLMSSLRVETRHHHEALENALRLLEEPLCEQRFSRVLQRFFGFHQIFEPAVARHERLAAIFVPRSRVDVLRADLAVLGLSPAEIDALPLCRGAEKLAADAATALGALYVIEGSTLGGQIISRALAGASWPVAQRLRSFNPYGEETGSMWRDFRSFAGAMGEDYAHPEIICGAQLCFDELRGWLTA